MPPIDMFKDPSVARLIVLLTDLSSHLLQLPASMQDDLPRAVLRFLCSKHPHLSNYPRILDLKSERDALERELDVLKRDVRLLLDDRRRAHQSHDDITI